jgi:hypothetical protein
MTEKSERRLSHSKRFAKLKSYRTTRSVWSAKVFFRFSFRENKKQINGAFAMFVKRIIVILQCSLSLYGSALFSDQNSFDEPKGLRLSEKTSDKSTPLFDKNNQPSFTLLQLLEIVGMESSNPSEITIMEINDWSQKNLLRQSERWVEQSDRFEKLKPILKPLLKELGFVDAVLPNDKDYQGAILHGSLLSRVCLRLHYLVEQWKQGIRFSDLYFLSGERPLEPEQENEQTLTNDEGSPLKIKKEWILSKIPKTECEMIQLVWEQSEIPQKMREIPVHFINAPMKNNPKTGNWLRPNTNDTVEAWLQTHPTVGCYLAVTNAPYMMRQDLVIRAIAPSNYSFETIGSSADENEKMLVFLDEVARCIFQIQKNLIK